MPDELVIRTDRTPTSDIADPGKVVTLALNRPDKLNALTPQVFASLRAHIDDLAGDESVGCVVLAGQGRSFCAGNDLGGISRRDTEAASADALPPLLAPETVDALESLPMPTIGRIQGHCFTGGLELALACDLLVAAEDAQMGDTHGQWGLAPMWGMSVRLPERVGRSRAKELMFTARRVSGAEAQNIGLVDRSVPADELNAHVDALADEIAANSRGTNRIDKALIADSGAMTRGEALLYERSRPYGLPSDMADRMKRGGR